MQRFVVFISLMLFNHFYFIKYIISLLISLLFTIFHRISFYFIMYHYISLLFIILYHMSSYFVIFHYIISYFIIFRYISLYLIIFLPSNYEFPRSLQFVNMTKYVKKKNFLFLCISLNFSLRICTLCSQKLSIHTIVYYIVQTCSFYYLPNS